MRADLRTSIAVIPVLVLLVLAGCGDDQTTANNAYVAAADRVVRAFETRFQTLQTDFTSVSTPRQDLTTLGKLDAAVVTVVADLRRVRAPARIARLHASLIAQVGGYRAVIQTAEKGFRATDPQVIVATRAAFSRALVAVTVRITATIDTINTRLR